MVIPMCEAKEMVLHELNYAPKSMAALNGVLNENLTHLQVKIVVQELIKAGKIKEYWTAGGMAFFLSEYDNDMEASYV